MFARKTHIVGKRRRYMQIDAAPSSPLASESRSPYAYRSLRTGDVNPAEFALKITGGSGMRPPPSTGRLRSSSCVWRLKQCPGIAAVKRAQESDT